MGIQEVTRLNVSIDDVLNLVNELDVIESLGLAGPKSIIINVRSIIIFQNGLLVNSQLMLKLS